MGKGLCVTHKKAIRHHGEMTWHRMAEQQKTAIGKRLVFKRISDGGYDPYFLFIGNVSIIDGDEENSILSQQDDFELPVPGISNGDTVTVYADISEETWTLLRNRGLYLSFECNAVQ